MVRVWGASMSDVTDRATRQLGVISDFAASVGVKGSDGSALQALRVDSYKRLFVQDAPWWMRRNGGRPVFLDDFEGTLKWSAPSGTITKDSTATFVHGGSYALKGVTAATPSAAITAYWAGPKPKTTANTFVSCGLHFILNAAADTTPRSFEIDLRLYDGTNVYAALVRYWHYQTTSQKKWQYYNSSAVWTDVPSGALPIIVTAAIYHDVELVLKRTASAWEYYKLVVDGVALDLAGLPIQAGANTSAPYYELQLLGITDAAIATTFYVDDLWLLEDLAAAD